MAEAKPIQEPPNNPPTVGLDLEDDFSELGDKIANLTLGKANQLTKYLQEQKQKKEY